MHIPSPLVVLLAAMLTASAQGDPLDHITTCLGHSDPAVRARLRVVFLAIPKTGSRHMFELLRHAPGMAVGQPKGYFKHNSACEEDRPALAMVHNRPQTQMLIDAFQRGNGSLDTCGIKSEELYAPLIGKWGSMLELARKTFSGLTSYGTPHTVPVITTVRDPIEHGLSLFSQQHGWRYFVPNQWQAAELRGVHEPGWMGSFRLFLNSQYSHNPQTAFLSGRMAFPVPMEARDFKDKDVAESARARMKQWPPSCLMPASLIDVTEADLETLTESIQQGTLIAGMVESMTPFAEFITRKLANMNGEQSPDQAKCENSSCASLEANSQGDDVHQPRSNDKSATTFQDRLRKEEVPLELLDQLRANTEFDRRLYDIVVAQFNKTINQ